MKTIIRNFLSVLRRFKMATALNVAGLAVAFAAFIVTILYSIGDRVRGLPFKEAVCSEKSRNNRPSS